MEFVQLQINYLDWESAVIQAKKCYETAVKHGKRVIVMEPVKGGSLASVPEEAEQILSRIHPEESMASWAIRFASSLEAVDIVLSGMNTVSQIEDNLRDVHPICEEEYQALEAAAQIIRRNTAVPCTSCGYCMTGCPERIPIPGYFGLLNEYTRSPKELWKMEYLYRDLGEGRGKASDCIECGACERACPQKIGIIGMMKKVRNVFEPRE